MAVNLFVLAGEVGFLIAIPLIVFVLLGIKLDRTLHTMPLFIVIGMLLAATVSTVAVARKVKQAAR